MSAHAEHVLHGHDDGHHHGPPVPHYSSQMTPGVLLEGSLFLVEGLKRMKLQKKLC